MATFPAHRILVPIDFSAESDLALQWASVMAPRGPDTSITLCHVLAPIAPLGPDALPFGYDDALTRMERSAVEKLKTLQAGIPAPLVSQVTVRIGHPASELEQLCAEQSLDLVVMTSHGRRGLSRLLHGTTTEEMVRRAPCPVLVLHRNDCFRLASSLQKMYA